MPFLPGISYHGDQYYNQAITGAANVLSGDLQKALARYEDNKKQREYNTGLLDSIKDLQDSNGQPYVPIEALQRWDALSGDRQAGVIAGAARRITYDLQQQAGDRAQQQLDIERNRIAQDNEPFTPSDDDFAAARRAGGELVEVQPGRYQFLSYPNSNRQGAGDGTPVADPRDPTKIIGIQQTNGVIKLLPRPTSADVIAQAIKEAREAASGGGNAGSAQQPGWYERLFGSNPTPTPTPPSKSTPPAMIPSPTPTPTPVPAARIKAPNGQIEFSDQDHQALRWAQANPKDPRSARILTRLGLNGVLPTSPSPPSPGPDLVIPPGNGRSLDAATAGRLLNQAGGDKDKARQLAKDAGYVFGSDAPVKVNTPDEAQNLSPGTRYQTPDGRIFVR